MDRQMARALDRYITGNYGEDNVPDVCELCGEAIEGKPYQLDDLPVCEDCFEHAKSRGL